jgi:hypothetical protein
MQIAVTGAGKPDDSGLLHLLREVLSQGRIVHHFVCTECLGLIEAVEGRNHVQLLFILDSRGPKAIRGGELR